MKKEMKNFVVMGIVYNFALATSVFHYDNYVNPYKLSVRGRSLSILTDVAVNKSPGFFISPKFCDK